MPIDLLYGDQLNDSNADAHSKKGVNSGPLVPDKKIIEFELVHSLSLLIVVGLKIISTAVILFLDLIFIVLHCSDLAYYGMYENQIIF